MNKIKIEIHPGWLIGILLAGSLLLVLLSQEQKYEEVENYVEIKSINKEWYEKYPGPQFIDVREFTIEELISKFPEFPYADDVENLLIPYDGNYWFYDVETRRFYAIN